MGGTFQKCTIQLEEEIDGKEHAEKLAEGHAHGRNRSGLNHQEQRPPVEKSPKRAQRLAQINVLPARSRHHGRQFAVAQSSNNGQEAGHQPGANQQCRRIHFARDFCRHNKDAGADHRAHDQHGRTGQAEALDQFLVLTSVEIPIAGDSGRTRVFVSVLTWCLWGIAGGTAAPAVRPSKLGSPADFTLRCAKMPLLICPAPVTSPISPPPSRLRPRSPSGSCRA